MNTKAIFYDPSNKRKSFVKWTGIIMLFLMIFLLVNFVLSVIIKPYLPTPLLISHYIKPQYHAISLSWVKTNDTYHLNNKIASLTGETNNLIDMYAFYVERDDAAFTSLRLNLDKIDTLVPEWLNLTASGMIELNPDKANRTLSYIRSHRETLKISALINNFDGVKNQWNGELVRSTLWDEIKRSNLIKNLISYLDNHKLDGISLDFENIDTATRQYIVTFVTELHPLLQDRGAELTINVPFGDDSVPYLQLTNHTDKIIVMAYDQHWANANPWSIAGITRYQSGLNQLQKTINPDKIIIAVGNYGYDRLSGSSESTTLTRQEALATMNESSGEITYDQQSLNPTFSYSDEQNFDHQVRYLDATTAYNQIAIGRDHWIGKYALWRLWSEDPWLWKLIDHHTFDHKQKPVQLNEMDDWYDISYQWSWLLLKLLHQNITWSRSIIYDGESNLITHETITQFPYPYIIWRYASGSGKQILLTFDDGPSEYTSQILDILKKYNVPAVFFAIWVNAQNYPWIIQREIDEWHIIGNHTFTHPDISTIKPKELQLELNSTQRIIEAITNRSTFLFRPPYSVDIEPRDIFEAQSLVWLNELWYYIMWLDIDPNDWENPWVNTITARTINLAKQGGHTILLHDWGGDRSQTIQALPQIITQLKDQWYTFIDAQQDLWLASWSVMPILQWKEEIFSLTNYLLIYLSSYLNWFIYYVFFIGIIIWLSRLTIVIILALYQKYKTNKTSHFNNLYTPSVTVIVPAYNEWIVIIKTIENLLQSDYQNMSIIIVDDWSTDDTLNIVHNHFGHYPDIIILTQPNAWKAAALNYGISKTKSDIIMIQDADTMFNHNVITLMVRHFVDTRVWAVAWYVRVGNIDSIIWRCQELEYMTSQNLDRRAYDVLNCITVVPGAIGAWRKIALEQVWWLTYDTLAEDCDLTLCVLRAWWRIIHEEHAIAWTEAPDTIKSFLKQRFRWMFGILQVTWKHSDVLFSFKSPWLWWFALPNLIIFQLIFPLLAPVLDIIWLINIVILMFHLFGNYSQTIVTHSIHTLLFYGIFIIVDALITFITFSLEKERSISLAFWFPIQRLLYRIFMYQVGIKVIYTALTGKGVWWNKLARTWTAQLWKS